MAMKAEKSEMPTPVARRVKKPTAASAVAMTDITSPAAHEWWLTPAIEALERRVSQEDGAELAPVLASLREAREQGFTPIEEVLHKIRPQS